jgi:hypothetical protein
MNLHIKGMVSLRCILFVKAILDELCIGYEAVSLGEVELKGTISQAQTEALKLRLSMIARGISWWRRSERSLWR